MKSLRNLASRPAAAPLAADDVVEFHAGRLLLLLSTCGGSAGAIGGLTKMAKLDFFVRYPDFFRAVESKGKSPAQSGAVETAMVRHHYGPWDKRYYHLLSYLEARQLITVRMEAEADSPSSTSRRKASAFVGLSGWDFAHFTTSPSISAERRNPVVGVAAWAAASILGRPRRRFFGPDVIKATADQSCNRRRSFLFEAAGRRFHALAPAPLKRFPVEQLSVTPKSDWRKHAAFSPVQLADQVFGDEKCQGRHDTGSEANPTHARPPIRIKF